MDSKELVSRLKEMIMEDQVQQVVALLLQEHQRLDVPFSEADLLQISGRLSSIEREKTWGSLRMNSTVLPGISCDNCW
jgi:hypothetical protein